MIRIKRGSHTISGVFVFLLLGIFAVCSTVMVLLGAQAYKGGADRTETHNAERIAAAYMRNKVREADGQDMIRLEGLEGAHSLQIVNDEEDSVTLLFVRDGMLCEWYTLRELFDEATFDPVTGAPLPMAVYSEGVEDDDDADPEETLHGDTVCALNEMTFSLSGRLLTIHLRNGQEWTTVDFALKSAPH